MNPQKPSMTATLAPEHQSPTSIAPLMASTQHARRSSRSSTSQPSYRVEKPKSNHNSPRVPERRRTTSSTKRYATLDDHFNMMFGISGEEEEKKTSTRPMSWHPSSRQTSRQPALSAQTPSSEWSRYSAHGSEFYSLSAQPQDYVSYTPSYTTHRSSRDSEFSFPSQSYSMSSYSTPSTEPMPWYLNEWARKNQAEAAGSRNGSTDFLPIQHPSTNDTVDQEDDDMGGSGEELVGMGLYDAPEPFSTLNSSSVVEGTGKGLKLEETWQPPEEDEDADGDDASSDEGSIEEPPAAEPATQLPIHNTKPQISANMEGQSFFFEEEENYTKDWCYQQMKQPPIAVQDAGLGYWLA